MTLNKLKAWWAGIATSAVMAATVVSGADLMTTILSLVGIVFVLGVSYQWKHSQLFGAIFCGLLASASYSAGFLANAYLNAFFLLPASLWGWWYWNKIDGERKSADTNAVIGLVVATLAIAGVVAIFTSVGGGTLPILDALTAVMPVFATLLMVTSFREQWLWWIPMNLLQCIMWFHAMELEQTMMAIFVLKIVFLVNSIIGYFLWKEYK